MAARTKPWGCCSNGEVEGDQHIECAKCNMLYHLACLPTTSFNKNSKLPSNWKCPACESSAPKVSKQDSTPVRSVTTTRGNKRPALTSPEAAVLGTEEVRTVVQDVIKTEFSSMIKEINKNMISIVNNQLEPLKQAMRDIQDSMSFMNSRFEEIEAEQSDAKKNMRYMQDDNLRMRNEIMELSQRLNNCEQQARAVNLELQCVPENKQENLVSIMNNLAAAVGSTLNDSGIMNCTRTAKVHADSTRPRSIVVQLASPRIRNELLAATISFNRANPQDKLNSQHLGVTGDKTPVYLVEHLSPANKALHGAARKKGKEHGYKYVWVRDGRIYARKTDDSEYIYIRNMDSLKKIV